MVLKLIFKVLRRIPMSLSFNFIFGKLLIFILSLSGGSYIQNQSFFFL